MHANPPSPPDRFLNGQRIVKIHSAAMRDGTESGQDTVWIWHTEPDLSAKLAEIAVHIRDYGERYRRYSESADSDAFRVYRRYIALSELYRRQTGFERYVVFGPGSLPASVWRRELDERCIAGDFVYFECNRCGDPVRPRALRLPIGTRVRASVGYGQTAAMFRLQ